MADLLADFGLDIVAQTELGVVSAEETGLTFIENAILKARHAAGITGLPAIADDSGLAVDALGGAPGIYSARYAGEEASDDENLQKLLEAMQDVADGQRRHSSTACWFICAMPPTRRRWYATAAGAARSHARLRAKAASATIRCSSCPRWAKPPPS